LRIANSGCAQKGALWTDFAHLIIPAFFISADENQLGLSRLIFPKSNVQDIAIGPESRK
jgi:hypothetical protein